MTKATAAHKAQTPQSRQKFGKYICQSKDSIDITDIGFSRYFNQYTVETCACYTRKGDRFVKVGFMTER